jgi:hypothetical protein
LQDTAAGLSRWPPQCWPAAFAESQKGRIMEKKGKIACIGLGVFIASVLIFDLWLDGNPKEMTISQAVRDAGQRLPWLKWAVGAGFVWLFVHLFWRWKTLYKRIFGD